MFPVERTYGEWAHSVFRGRRDRDGRPLRRRQDRRGASCQDCHMPDASGHRLHARPAVRPSVRTFRCTASRARTPGSCAPIRALYPDTETGLNAQSVDNGHRRPTWRCSRPPRISRPSNAERRAPRPHHEHGRPQAADRLRRGPAHVVERALLRRLPARPGTRRLRPSDGPSSRSPDTTVYEIEHGVDATMSAATGVPVGKSFHFLLNNTTEKDNRIPARGFPRRRSTRRSAPTSSARTTPTGQYWSDVPFDVPANATRAEVRLYHQTTSKEYITFLRDENVTDNTGRDAYRLWEAFGKSEPVEMAAVHPRPGDARSCFAPRLLDLGKARAERRLARELAATGNGSVSRQRPRPGRDVCRPRRRTRSRSCSRRTGQTSVDHFGGVAQRGRRRRAASAMGTTTNAAR